MRFRSAPPCGASLVLTAFRRWVFLLETQKEPKRSPLLAIAREARLRGYSPLRTPKMWSSSKKAKKRRSAAFFFTLFHSSPIDPFGAKYQIFWLFVGGGVLDAPQVCVVTRSDIDAHFPWFVGRGLDPSMGTPYKQLHTSL